MVTATLPAQPAINTTLEQMLAGLTGAGGKTGIGTATATVDGGLLDILRGLTSGLGGSDFSKEAAVSDIGGVVNTLARQAMEQTRPTQAAGLRGAGLRSSTTQTLLQNDSDARIQGELARVIQQNIASYGQLQQGQVNAAAGATNASRQTGAQSSSDALRAALTQGALGIGGNILKEGAVKGVSALRDLFSSPTAVAGGAGAVDMTGFFTPPAAFDFGGGGGAATGALGSGTFDFGGTSGLTDFFSDVGSSATDAVGGIADVIGEGFGSIADSDFGTGISDAVGGIGDFFGDIGSSISDFFGSWFEDGGRIPMGAIPVVSGSKKIPLGRGGDFGARMVPAGYADGGKVVDPKTAKIENKTAQMEAVSSLLQSLQDFGGNPKRQVEQRAAEVSMDSPMLGQILQMLGIGGGGQAAPAKPTGKEDGGVIDGKPAPHIGDNKQAKVNGTPVGLRGGEYIIPTDVVDIIGEDVFDQMVAAYHTPRSRK